MNAWKWLLGSVFIAVLSSCAPLTGNIPGPGPVNTGAFPDAETLIQHLKDQNDALITFKGQGTFALWYEGVLTRERMAFAGRRPDMLRVAVRGITGMPLATLASNGEYVYFISHYDQQFFKRRTDDPSLERILHMPVTTRDIIAFLSGRIPLPRYRSAWVTPHPGGDGYFLVLKTGWIGQGHQRVYFDGSGNVSRMEMYGGAGALEYRVEFMSRSSVEGFAIFDTLLITNGSGTRFRLDTEVYQPNAEASPSLFVLAPRS